LKFKKQNLSENSGFRIPELNLKIYFALAEEDAAALPSLGRIGVVVVLEPRPVKK
jgi:hypothetical protein